VLRAVVGHARPGISTADLDKVAADVLARHGAGSPFLNCASSPTEPFPAERSVPLDISPAIFRAVRNVRRQS
jgi:hypothetical protein